MCECELIHIVIRGRIRSECAVCSVAQSCPALCYPMGPLSMELSRKEYWRGLPFSSPGDLTDPRMEPVYLVSPALAGIFVKAEPPGKPW